MSETIVKAYHRRIRLIEMMQEECAIQSMMTETKATNQSVNNYLTWFKQNGVTLKKTRVNKMIYYKMTSNREDAETLAREEYKRQREIEDNKIKGQAGWFGILTRNEPIKI